jgi:hypothetical protein
MNCDEYTKEIIPAGTILYNGIFLPTNKCPPKYKYKNTNEYSNKYILYTTNNINTAKGYAGSCITKKGWIRFYRVLKDIELANITHEQAQYEVQNVINKFCDCDGYYLEWGTVKEIVFCDPKDKLEFLGAHDCLGKGLYYTNNNKCNNNNQNGGVIKIKSIKDKRYGKYQHGDHTHKTRKACELCKKSL